MPGLRKLAERDFPGVPRSKLGYIIDCTTVPPTFGHFRLDDDCTGGGENQSCARPELRRMALESNGKASLVTWRLQQGTGCQEKSVMVEISEATTPEYPACMKRAVGQDAKGNALETRSDVVDLVLHKLDIKDPDFMDIGISKTPTPVKHLCDRIDGLTNASTQDNFPMLTGTATFFSTLKAVLDLHYDWSLAMHFLWCQDRDNALLRTFGLLQDLKHVIRICM